MAYHCSTKFLSLLLRHQFHRKPCVQIHNQVITSGVLLHGDHKITSTIVNTLLRHYSLGVYPQEAILLYIHQSTIPSSTPDQKSFTFSFLLKACANLLWPKGGTQFHGLTIKNGLLNVYVHTSLVNMYSECRWLMDAMKLFNEMPEKNCVTWNVVITGLTKWGEIDWARSVFDSMPSRNVVSWTGMIDGYTRAGRAGEALVLFRDMIPNCVFPTEVTLLSVIPAVSILKDLDVADLVHGYCHKVGIDVLDVRIKNSLIDMYAKCGCIAKSLQVFEEMADQKNLVSWTSIVSGFAMHGMAEDAVRYFLRMEETNVRPNSITFLSVLNACSHGGLVEEGLRFLSHMLDKYGIEPEMKHYGCMIDMMGRVGRLEEAERMVLEMPVKANAVVWRTLLGCCHKHGNAEMGEKVMRRIMELEKGYSGDYVILSNVLAGAGRFGEAEGVRQIMDERNVSKIPGRSLI